MSSFEYVNLNKTRPGVYGGDIYDFTSPIGQPLGFIVVIDNVIVEARAYLKVDSLDVDTRGYPFDRKNVLDCAAWMTGKRDMPVMMSTEVLVALNEANQASKTDFASRGQKVSIDDQIFNAFMNRG